MGHFLSLDISKVRLTWLFVIDEKRKIAEGRDRKNPRAAAKK